MQHLLLRERMLLSLFEALRNTFASNDALSYTIHVPPPAMLGIVCEHMYHVFQAVSGLGSLLVYVVESYSK